VMEGPQDGKDTANAVSLKKGMMIKGVHKGGLPITCWMKGSLSCRERGDLQLDVYRGGGEKRNAMNGVLSKRP